MNFGDLKSEVEVLVKDASFADKYGMYINEALLEVADRTSLPDLKRIDVVSTVVGENYVSLLGTDGPTGGFSGKLKKVVKSADNETIRIYQNLDELFDETGEGFSDEGEVEAVALEGRTLWYSKIPATAESLRILYYQNPPELVDDDEECLVIPASLHRKILIHGAARIIFGIIEEGLDETQKINTLVNDKIFEDGILGLHAWIGGRREHKISSCWRV